MNHEIIVLKKSRSNGAFTRILRMGWVEKGQQMYSNTQLRERKKDSVSLYICTWTHPVKEAM